MPLSPEVRWKGLKALQRFGPRVVPDLVRALREEADPAVRRLAADALGRIGPAAGPARPELVRAAVQDGDGAVRRAAARALRAVSGQS